MEKLQIGEVIFKLRKEKEVTQEQLGKFIGVSTAAVSKWEGGISYPDITLLPILATFFNVSIDKLLNFKVELSDDEVMKIFSECEIMFSSGNIEEAINRSKSYLLKYPGSYYLKLRIGFIFTMYSWKGSSEEKSMNMMEEAIELFEDVALNCSKIELVEAALFQLGALYSSIGKEEKAIESLNKIHKTQCDPNDILSRIYIEKNEFKKARELLQSKLYKNIIDISMTCMGLASSYSKGEKDLNRVEKYNKLSIEIKKVLSPEADSVLSLWTDYFCLAETYLKSNKKKEAIEILQKMTEDIRRNNINKSGKFSSIWCFNEIPDSEKTITMNLYENLFKMLEHEIFNEIRDTEDFINILKELKDSEKNH